MFKKIDNDLIIKLLLLSFPILLISGPLLPEISIIIIFIILSYKFVKREIHIPKNYFLIGFLFFYLLIVLSAFFSDYFLISLKPTVFYFRFLFLIIAVLFILEKDINFLNLLKKILLITFLILIFDGFYQFVFEKNIIGLKNANVNRISSFFGKELIYGSYLARFLPILVGCMIFFEKSRLDRIMIYSILILTLSAIFISGERAALLLSFLSILIIIFLTNFFTKSKFLILILSILTFFILSFSNEYIKYRWWNMTLNSAFIKTFNNSITYENKKYPLILNEKYTFMSLSAFKMFKDKPLIGHGVKTFRKKCKVDPYKFEKFDIYKNRMNCSTHPHNTYTQLLSETGLLSFIIVISYFFFISYQLLTSPFKKKKQKSKKIFDLKICILSCIFINLFPLTTTGSFFNNWLSMVYFFPIGILFYIDKYYRDT